MKVYHTILLSFFSLLAVEMFAQQSGTITYTEITKLSFDGLEGMDIGDMMPAEMNTSKALYFDKSVSVYRNAEDHVDEDIEMESDDGSFQLVIGTGSSEEILHTDLKEKKSLYQTSFMDKEFLIESELDKPKWKITNERIKYLGFVCQKATMTETVEPTPGSEEEAKEREIVAWFTAEIPVSIGPSNYNQLPGAILMVSVDEGKTEIKATEVIVAEPSADRLEKPTNGQRVNQAEYDVIIAEKMKEMQEMYGGREGSSIIIRG